MFDLFGMNKIDARDAVQEMMCGATRGLLEGYEYRLEQKNYEITNLMEEIGKQKAEIAKLKADLEIIEDIRKETSILKDQMKKIYTEEK